MSALATRASSIIEPSFCLTHGDLPLNLTLAIKEVLV